MQTQSLPPASIQSVRQSRLQFDLAPENAPASEAWCSRKITSVNQTSWWFNAYTGRLCVSSGALTQAFGIVNRDRSALTSMQNIVKPPIMMKCSLEKRWKIDLNMLKSSGRMLMIHRQHICVLFQFSSHRISSWLSNQLPALCWSLALLRVFSTSSYWYCMRRCFLIP